MSQVKHICQFALSEIREELDRRRKWRDLQRKCPFCGHDLRQPNQHDCIWAERMNDYVERYETIRIVEGGERLYAFPFAYDSSNLQANRFHYVLDEQYPYPHEMLATNDPSGRHLKETYCRRLTDRLRWWWALGPGKRLWALRYRFGFFRRAFGWKAALTWAMDYENIGVLLAADYPDIRLHLPRQLQVVDTAEFTETIYLNPTDKWVTHQLETVVPYPHQTQERDDYQQWQRRWSFCNTGFLLVLDT